MDLIEDPDFVLGSIRDNSLYHRGDALIHRGQRVVIREVRETTLRVEDEEGFAYVIPIPDPGYTAEVDGEGWVTSIENREGDPAFNGAFDKW